MYNPIPEEVLEKILQHRPHMAAVVANHRAAAAANNVGLMAQTGKAIADNYLMGETRLSAIETWRLSYMVTGLNGGGYAGAGRPPADLPTRPSCPACGAPMLANGRTSTGERAWRCRCGKSASDSTGRPAGRPKKPAP